MSKYNVFDTVSEKVVRVDKIDPTIHYCHSSMQPFTKADLEVLDVVSKKEAK